MEHKKVILVCQFIFYNKILGNNQAYSIRMTVCFYKEERNGAAKKSPNFSKEFYMSIAELD